MRNTLETIPLHRKHKSRVFEMIFQDKEKLLELYNAVNGTTYDNPDELEINTLENAVYMSMHNDISFIIDFQLTLYEQQSTYCPNMPLRFLDYVRDLYSDITKNANLYGTKLVKIPTPHFVVFYNGEKECPDVMELKLSDAFIIPEEDPALELKAVMLNVNKGRNEKLMQACKTLRDYAEYTYRVRLYAQTMDVESAVRKTIKECMENDILAEFLHKNQAEAISMSIYEYDEKKHLQMEREDAREEGRKEGREEGRQEERANTERERKRADEAEAKLRELEKKLASFPSID